MKQPGMSEIINLRRARKVALRKQAEDVAAQNRARHGRTLADRAQEAANAALVQQRWQSHALTPLRSDDER